MKAMVQSELSLLPLPPASPQAAAQSLRDKH